MIGEMDENTDLDNIVLERYWGNSDENVNSKVLERLNAKLKGRSTKSDGNKATFKNHFGKQNSLISTEQINVGKRKLNDSHSIENTETQLNDSNIKEVCEDDRRITDDKNNEPITTIENNVVIIEDESKPKKRKKNKKENEDKVTSSENETNSQENKIISLKDTKPIDEDLVVPIKKEDLKPVGKKNKKKRKSKAKLNAGEKEIGGFTVLGDVHSTRSARIKRVLPHWLKNPILIGHSLTEDSIAVSDVSELSSSTKDQLKMNNINILFPVQQAVIPALLNRKYKVAARYRPRDICVSAPTGSGKTLSYVLPIVEMLQNRKEPRIRAMVLLPVQELARQVYKVFLTYGDPLGLKIGLAVGQKSFSKEQTSLVQQDYCGYHSLVDILVATPGRLSDHIAQTSGFDLSALRYLVLDEADKLLSGESADTITSIQRLINKCIPQRLHSMGTIPSLGYSNKATLPPLIVPPLQRLLFSATLSHDPEQLQHVTLHRPMLVTVAPREKGDKKDSNLSVIGQYTRPAELTENYVITAPTVKPLIVHHMIISQSWKKTLIFTNSKESTHKLSVLLQVLANDKYSVSEFSADQGRQRAQIVSQFSSGKIDVLVSSDAMARGLDIPDIEHVVSYDVTSLSTYIHRVGRTARAGKTGAAISLVTSDELRNFKRLLIGTSLISELSVPMVELESYEDLYIESLNKMKSIINEENKSIQTQIPRNAYGKNVKKGFNGRKPNLSGSNMIQM